MPPARRQAYLRLMRRAGIIRLWGPPPQQTAKPGAPVTFNAQMAGIVVPEKSWVYSIGPLNYPIPIPLTDGDTAAYRFPPGAYRRVCRPIETHWYICVDYED